MNTLYFKVTLLTDVILNQKAATEGPNATLDFIPGNNFLGIVASALYNDKLDAQKALDLFHNGSVRYGDAHLVSLTGARTLKVPAVMFYPKLKSADQELYISLLASPELMRDKQLKQCRSGYYDFTATNHQAVPSVAQTNFAIKSAHDRKNRTSLNEAMYGYESLQAGAELLFSVEVENPDYEKEIIDALTSGTSKRIGRSRSAQFGLVKIEHLDGPYAEVASAPMTGKTVTVYADSRLIFIDEATGMPTFRPEASQLGLEGGEIDWEKSQVRTFQYAPWNFKRQCFDTDRCGIEKGSVFVVKGVKECPTTSQYKGSYCNEGFGRVIYNAAFLAGNDKTAESEWTLLKVEKPSDKPKQSTTRLNVSGSDSPLLAHLKQQFNHDLEEQQIFNLVNEWIHANNDENWRRFKTKKFASQWGTIRSIATRRLMDGGEGSSFRNIADELYRKVDDKEQCGYLCHGVAGPNWEENGRLKSFENFMKKEEIKAMSEEKKCLTIINLAAEMAKMYRKENNK